MTSLKIRDIAVISRLNNGGTPIGEAPERGANFNPMSEDERHEMSERLSTCIIALMDIAHDNYVAFAAQNSEDPAAMEYITRLSTNEFFFIRKSH